MPRGGKREGAGRKVGSATRKTREIADKAAEEGITPLEYMLHVMRDPSADTARRDEMAKAAAPYSHARLQQIEAKVDAHTTQCTVSAEPLTPEAWVAKFGAGGSDSA